MQTLTEWLYDNRDIPKGTTSYQFLVNLLSTDRHIEGHQYSISCPLCDLEIILSDYNDYVIKNTPDIPTILTVSE